MSAPPEIPTRRARLLVAVLVGLCAAAAMALTWHLARGPEWWSDWDSSYNGAQAWLAGRDPYADSWRQLNWWWRWPLAYPMPAVLLAVPFTLVPLPVARVLFVGLAVGVLAFGLTRRGWWGLALLLSGGGLQAMLTAQWTLWLAAAVLLPAWGWIVAVKPTTGLVTLAGMRSRRDLLRAIGGAAALTVLSLLLWPTWPRGWLTNLAGGGLTVRPLFLRPWTSVSLLGWLAWRYPAGRMLGMLALAPHTETPYNILPVLVAIQGRTPALVVTVVSAVGLVPWLLDYRPGYPWGWHALTAFLPLIGAVLADAYAQQSRGRRE
jgi:hypothetical protein